MATGIRNDNSSVIKYWGCLAIEKIMQSGYACIFQTLFDGNGGFYLWWGNISATLQSGLAKVDYQLFSKLSCMD